VAPPFRVNQPESPPASEQQTFETTVPVCETGRAKLLWHAFKQGSAAFITNYSVELLESSPGNQVTVAEAPGSDRAVGTEGFVRQVNIGVHCDHESFWQERTQIAYVTFNGLGGSDITTGDSIRRAHAADVHAASTGEH
jgi:hypothetical protein